MKITVISAIDQPTLPDGPNGLGRLAWTLATQLHKRGHEVALMAGPGSEFDDGLLNITTSETWRAENWETHGVYNEAIIDLSHLHDLSRLRPALPVINWVADLECPYTPPNCVVGNEFQARNYPKAEIVRPGVAVDEIPFYSHNNLALTPTDQTPYVAFCAKIHHFKGWDLALEAAERAGVEIRFAGFNYAGVELPNYVGEIHDNAKLYDFIGNAIALLAPSRRDSGGLIPLQAAATGTPTITTDATGTQYHVKHAVSGFVCRDVEEMAAAIRDVHLLDRAKVRAWVKDSHDMPVMIDAIEELCRRVAAGERW